MRILDVTAGRHVFRLHRSQGLILAFTHASPGTGTRVVSVDMTGLRGATEVQVFLTWHPDSISLSVGSLGEEQKLLRAEGGEKLAPRLIVGDNGETYEIGDVGVEVSGFRAYEGDQLVVEPPAVEAWKNTLDAIGVLQEGQVEEDARFEIVQANAIVTMLVTGFEAYGQKRFRELAGEGISPDIDALAKAFPRIRGETEEVAKLLSGNEKEVLPYVARTGINFQNYGDFKKAYKAGFGLQITRDAEVSSEDVQRLKAAISLRHRIIHVSPLEVIRSKPGDHPPEFVNRDYAEETVALFSRFINALHVSTLTLRSIDVDSQESQPV